MFKNFLLILILFKSFIFSMDDVCSSCENTWWDPYWGEQCCDAAWDQWGFDCSYMEDDMAGIVQDVIVLMMNKKFVVMDFVQEMKILIHVPLIAQKMVVM